MLTNTHRNSTQRLQCHMPLVFATVPSQQCWEHPHRKPRRPHSHLHLRLFQSAQHPDYGRESNPLGSGAKAVFVRGTRNVASTSSGTGISHFQQGSVFPCFWPWPWPWRQQRRQLDRAALSVNLVPSLRLWGGKAVGQRER